tara:strand:+ start:140 stop:490 length:351 start_codon:yes stop_codon:yes gene_type:complete
MPKKIVIKKDKKVEPKKKVIKIIRKKKEEPKPKKRIYIKKKQDVNCLGAKNNADSIITFYTKNKGVLKNDASFKSKKDVLESIELIKNYTDDKRCTKAEKNKMRRAVDLHNNFKKK